MQSKVFISYRREDSADYAGRIHDRLKREFGADLLLMDVDDIPLGVDFTKVLRDEVAKCNVLLALIGPNWLNVRDKEGNRRLDDPADFQRIEIATALQRDIPVIPILLDGARMPRADELPQDLEELSLRGSVFVLLLSTPTWTSRSGNCGWPSWNHWGRVMGSSSIIRPSDHPHTRRRWMKYC
jgi:hypothetical protein